MPVEVTPGAPNAESSDMRGRPVKAEPRIGLIFPQQGFAVAAFPAAYPPIERLGVIGDRRTAAMVAPDGTVNWLCLPNYDGVSLFGALLDHELGGFWHLGPTPPCTGQQTYSQNTAVLVTTFCDEHGTLELTDCMLHPETDRSPTREDARVVVRRLRCTKGRRAGSMRLRPRLNFSSSSLTAVPGGFVIEGEELIAACWTSQSASVVEGQLCANFDLADGEVFWAVLDYRDPELLWSTARAQLALEETENYWRGWVSAITYIGPRKDNVLRSAINFHLLTFAPTGALVAAPTTSLPERIGGNRNYDYRYAWIRDVSLSLAILSMLGDLESSERYMDWLVTLGSASELPLQVLYRIDGRTDTTQLEREELNGYRGSTPVREGNHASQQLQFDSFGYLADCAQVYLKQGGRWKAEYWKLIKRVADYTAENWERPDHGIWELSELRHNVSSKVMSWVTLDRAASIAERQGVDAEAVKRWRASMDKIHSDVMNRGWSDSRQCFRQHYDADALDASVLLIPLMKFLPADHPRVLATMERILSDLSIDGLIYRFDPKEIPGETAALGEFEGAFLPPTFWMSAALSMTGRASEAEAILARVEAIAGPLGLLAEEADPRAGIFLGNTPLLFSHAEYLKAVIELAKARPLNSIQLMVGMAVRRVKQGFGRG